MSSPSTRSTRSTRRPSLAVGLLLATCAGWLSVVPAQAADLTVVVSNITSNAGNVMVGPFDSAAAFPKTVTQGVLAAATGRDATGRMTLVLRDLTPGTYAVSAYHDLDANGQLNNNMMGLPVEPYGFANNARGSFGPPSFQAASVALPTQGLAIELKVQ
ncbi:MAG: DUF2141 domain-containing protein [Betaproteobacteria bacterium]|nr:DUF2141 domain-containing protein [Betaproteobacteria bacterium]